MNCPKCNRKISIKKNQTLDCQCGSNLLAVEINKELKIFNLRKDGK